ncbi:Protein of unknown function [Pseudomonas sp. ok272]|uniref:DUF1120 domain-containing protein n=1 Tax=unclassified Pseudomonas TaxID=196821 RepID=UPI0008ABCB0B|nr:MULTISPECIES: DUF1120 domain-containing protein [unclassified Pseudomonas]SEM32333.1 Protein of unknown function [Pseudomonas sp. ok272]SFM32263.1 Protein of unknown function [Pseudomonas sp. ok602]
MNTLYPALATALFLTCAPSAFAASTVDLTVTGKITPSACTPSLSGGGVVDHGKISAKDLRPNNSTSLPKVILQFRVNCEAHTQFAIKPTDNRAGSSTQSSDFGLGLVNGNKKLGRFYLDPLNMIADTTPVQPIVSNDGGSTWHAGSYWELEGIWGVAATDDGTTLLAVKDLSLDFQVSTQIARADQFDFTDEVTLDGSATLDIKYL